MRKLMLGLSGVAIFAALSLATVSPSRAQGPEPKVKITNWGDGYTTLALAFGTIVNGMAGGEFTVQFDSNTSKHQSYTAATVRPVADDVALTLEADPPLGPSEGVAYNEGVDQLGNNTALIVFRVRTDPNFDWTSVTVQAYDADDVRQPDLLNRAIADAEVGESPDDLPSYFDEIFPLIYRDKGWALRTRTKPLVIYGDGSSNTIGQLLTFDPNTIDNPDAPGFNPDNPDEEPDLTIDNPDEERDLTIDNPDSPGFNPGNPDAASSAANTSPTMVVTPADDGSGRVRNIALGLLAALVIASLFTWKIRDKIVERVADSKKPLPGPYYDDSGDATGQDQPDDPPDDGFVDIKL